MKLEFSRQIFEKYSSIEFHENPLCGSRIIPCGWTDRHVGMAIVIVAFHSFVNVPEKVAKHWCRPYSRGIKTRL